jgi:[acyl-carrier-protein] S-malonyltransferase
MGKELFQLRPEAQATFKTVQFATGVDVASLCFDSDEDVLRETQNAQLALFTVSVAAFRCLKRHLDGEIRIEALAGHSVGEYAACVAAGILDLAEGADLVYTRGLLMAEAGKERPGTMAAVLGLEREVLEDVLAQVTTGLVVIANDNCPGQLVISGEIEAVAEASRLASEKGARKVMPLRVSGAFHSPLVATAAEGLGPKLEKAKWSERGNIGPVYSNVTSEAVGRESDLPGLLKTGLVSPVRWTESVEHMSRDGIETYIECGVGDVLSGLIKRIDREAKSYRVQDLDTLESTVATLRP